MKVEELQKRLMGMEEEASAARSAATESLRLTDENTLLGHQLKQMEFNLKVCLPNTCLGNLQLSFFILVTHKQCKRTEIASHALNHTPSASLQGR